jgi:diketogulonate reductase-like aldo/keto reductase
MPGRIEENFTVFDFHLNEAEMEAIEALDVGERTGPDPTRSCAPGLTRQRATLMTAFISSGAPSAT